MNALPAAIGLHSGGVARPDVRERRVAPLRRPLARFRGPSRWASLLGTATALAGGATWPDRRADHAGASPVSGTCAVRTGAIAHRDIACAGPIGPAGTAGIEHLLAFLAAEILARRFARLHIGLGEFLAHLGIVVSHAVPVIRVVLPV